MKNPGQGYNVTNLLLVKDSAEDIPLLQDALRQWGKVK
jgi:hypothetical protein